MGTKTKLTTKVLSFFLSVLMAVSCFSIALPDLAPQALAAEREKKTQALTDALADAENGGYLATDYYAVATDEYGNATVNDTSENGFIYGVVRAVAELAKTLGEEEGDPSLKHNSGLASYITSLVSANQYQAAFIQAILPESDPSTDPLNVKTFYGVYDGIKPIPNGVWNGIEADYSELPDSYTFTTVVTRSEKGAVLTDYATAYDVPAQVENKLTVTFETVKVGEPSDVVLGGWRAYYKNDSITLSASTTPAPDLTAIRDYLDFVNDAALFADSFAAWQADAYAVYFETADALLARYNTFVAKMNAANTADADYVEQFIGAGLMNEHLSFAKDCLEASGVVPLKKYVDWINGTLTEDVQAMDGYMHKDGYMVDDVQRMTYLRDKATGYLSAVNAAGAAVKARMSEAYGYNTVYVKTDDTFVVPNKTYYALSQSVAAADDGTEYVQDTYTATAATDENLGELYEMVSYEAYIAELDALIKLWNLRDIKDAAQTLMNSSTPEFYVFPAASRFSVYTLTADTAPVLGKTYYTKDEYGLYVPAVATADNIASLYEAEGNLVFGMGGKCYDSEAYLANEEVCPVDDFALADAYAFFFAAQTYLAGCDETLLARAGLAGQLKDDINEMAAALRAEIAYRKYDDGNSAAAEDFRVWYQAFITMMLTIDPVTCSDATLELMAVNVATNYDKLVAAKNALDATADAETKARYGKFVQKCYDYVSSIYGVLLDRCYNKFNALYVAAGSVYNGSRIDGSNFSLVKGMIANLDDNRDTPYTLAVENNLYDWLQARTTTVQARVPGAYDKLRACQRVKDAIPAYLSAANAIMSAHWNGYTRYYNDHVSYTGGAGGTSGYVYDTNGNGTGIYTVRDGRASDMARSDDNKDYVVSATRINNMIAKLDTFVAGKDFMKMIGQYDPDKGVTDLKTFVKQLLVENLFSDEMVNTFVSMLFPMITDLVSNKLIDMITENLAGATVADPSGAFILNLNTLMADLIFNKQAVPPSLTVSQDFGPASGSATLYLWTLQGNIAVFWNGTGNALALASGRDFATWPFSTIFHNWGVDIFPSTLAGYLSGKNNANYAHFIDILNTLAANGDSWNGLDNNNDGEIDQYDFARAGISWGVHDYASFITVMGDLLGAAGDILNTLFTGQLFLKTHDRMVGVYISDMKIYAEASAKLFGVGLLNPTAWGNIGDTAATGSATIALTGVLGYNDLWLPIMEALGVTGYTSSYDVGTDPTTSAPLSSSLGFTDQAHASSNAIVNGLFLPLMWLIEKIADRPLDTVLGMLPNLAYNIAYDNVKTLMNALNVGMVVTADVSIGSFGSAQIEDLIFDWDFDIAWLLNSSFINNAIEDALNSALHFDTVFQMSELIDLNSILPFDITNLNDILKYLLNKMGDGGGAATIPPLNAGRIGGLGSKDTRWSARSGNVANYVTADKADVLYEIVRALVDFVSVEGSLSEMLANLGGQGLGADVELILAGVDTDETIAALVELFEPQEYDMSPYNWYVPNSAASSYTFNESFYEGTMAQGGFVYLKYGNQWTRERAENMFQNLETVADDVFNMIDPDNKKYNGISDWLQKTINKMFRNKFVKGFVDFLVDLSAGMDSESKLLTNMLKEQLRVGGSDASVDFYSWYYRFGYLNPELRTLGTQKIYEVNAAGQVVERTVNEVLYIDQYGNICVGYPEADTAEIDGQETPVTVMKFLRTYPLAPEGFAGFTENADGELIPAASGSNLPGRYGEANITYRYAPKYAQFSSKRYDNYTVCNISADGQYAADSIELYPGKWVENKNKASDLFPSITPVILNEEDEDGNIIHWQFTGDNVTARFGLAANGVYVLQDGSLGGYDEASGANQPTARAVYFALISSLLEPFAPAFSFILNHKDLELFNSALVVKGYDVYNGALIPLLEASGVKDLPTSEEYNATYGNDPNGGFYYLANVVFETLDEILTKNANGTPLQKIINLLPGLYYYLQSDGLGVLLKNILMPIWVLVDDVRPLVDVNLDLIIHGVAGKLLGLETDTGSGMQNAVYNLLVSNMDLEPILDRPISDPAKLQNTINAVSLKQLSLKALANLLGEFSGMYLQPLFYAFDGMCYGYTYNGVRYGVVDYNSSAYNIKTYNAVKSKTDFTAKKLTYLGPDTLTVTISALLDLLRFRPASGKSNAQALDELIGLARELMPDESIETTLTATGLLDGLEKVFAARVADHYVAPNWDYMLEGKLVRDPNTGNTIVWTANTDWRVLLQFSDLSELDLHHKHDDVTKRALGYKTDWTRETVVSMDTLFATLLDWVTTSFLAKDDASINNFADFANSLINETLLGADTLKSLAGVIAMLYQNVPASIIAVIDDLLSTDLLAWQPDDSAPLKECYFRRGDSTNVLLDSDGKPVKVNGVVQYEDPDTYYVNDEFKWWATVDGVKVDANGDPILDVFGNTIPVKVPVYADDYVDTRDKFFDAFYTMVHPVASLFGFIFLEDGYKFFYSAGDKLKTGEVNTVVDISDDTDAIVLEGLGIWGRGLLPLLETLGLPKILENIGESIYDYEPSDYTTDTPGVYASDRFLSDFIHLIRVFAEGIIADPVGWLLDNLPNLIYFINANGIATIVKNVFDSVQDILDMINTQLEASDKISSSNLAGINLADFTLDGLFKLLEKATAWEEGEGAAAVKHPGLHVRDDLVQYIKDLYFGELTHYMSANGKDAFRMDALATDPDGETNREDRANFITVLVALVLEIAEDKGVFADPDNGFASTEYDNPACIDALANAHGLIAQVIDAVRNPTVLVKYENINWNYFDENVNLADVNDDDKTVNVPAYLFTYLNYTTQWTYDKALATATGLESMVLSILKMVDEDQFGSVTGLGELINTDIIYNGKLLQSLLDMLADVLYGPDSVITEELLNVAGCLLGADLTQWNRTYAFASEEDFEGVATQTDATGMQWASLPAKVARVDADGKKVKDENGDVIYDEGAPIKTYLVNDRASFVAALTLMLQPAYRLLDWLLFNDSYDFFNGNTAATENDILISLPGCEGYARGLVLLLEALGCEGLKYPSYYETADGVDTAAYMSDILTAVCNRVDAICADPVNQLVGLIPELIYFINAGGLQTVVMNLLAGPVALVNNLDALKSEDAGDAVAVVDSLICSALDEAFKDKLASGESTNFTMAGINLQFIFSILELVSGLEITDCVGNKLDKFYMGLLYRYNSMSGENDVAYKMIFSNEEDFADFITIMLSLVIDVLLWEDDEKGINNADALAELIPLEDNDFLTGEEMKLLISEVINFLKDGFLVENPMPIDWLYFDSENSVYDANDELKDPLPDITPETEVRVPDRFINYLTYASDWTDELAHYIYNNRNELISTVLTMANLADTEVLGMKLGDIFNNGAAVKVLDQLYTAQNLNAILNAIQDLTAQVPEVIFELLHIVLDLDFSAFNEANPNFVGYFDETVQIDENHAAGVMTRDDFIDGLVKILNPLSTVLDWLLFGANRPLQYFDKKDYTDNSVEVLLTINGANGYDYGLVPILEMLGIDAPASTSVSSIRTMLAPILKALLSRVEEILADPVDEVLEILPNLLYFINARGLIASVENLLIAPMALLDRVNDKLDPDGTKPEKRIDINRLLSSLKIAGDTEVNIFKLDLKSLLTLAEDVTGMQIISEHGFIEASKIENFYFGKIELSKSANGKVRGAMRYTAEEDAADMLTILVNMVVEMALHSWEETDPETGAVVKKSNAGALEKLLGLETGTITGIIDAIDTLGTEAIPGNYHWNYFNEIDDSFDNSEGYTQQFYFRPKEQNLFLNYLTYDPGQNWSRETADAIYQNLGSVIDAVLSASGDSATTVGEMLSGMFDLYTGENLDAIVGLIDQLYEKVDNLVELIGLVLGADLSVWNDMTKFADLKDDAGNPAINDRASFRTGLITILEPLYPVLDWLLFGKTYGFFVKDADGNVNADGERLDGELLALAGSQGYAYALVPLLETLGVELPACKVGETTCGTKDENGFTFFERVVDAILLRVEEILAHPVDEALQLLPQIIYFVNANGVATMAENLLGAVKNAADALVQSGVLKVEGDATPANIAEYVYELAGIDIGNLDLEGIISVLEQQPFMKGLKINEVFTRQDLNGDGTLDNILEYFYMGAGAQRYESSVTNADGTRYAIYKLRLEDTDPAHPYVGGDVLTTLLCIVLEVLMYENALGTANAQPIADLVNSFVEGASVTAENVEYMRTLLRDGAPAAEMRDANWAYVYGDMTAAARQAKIVSMLTLDTNTLNELPARTVNYLTYDAKNNPKMLNLWSEDAVSYVDANLDDIINRAVDMATGGECEDLHALIENNLDIFSDDTANSLMDALRNALGKVDELLGGDSATTNQLLNAVGKLLGIEDLSSIRNASAHGISGKADFVDFLADTLSVLDPVLEWLLFGGSYKFFTKLDGEDAGKPHTIQLNGGQGYKYGLAPILDALGVSTDLTVAAGESKLHKILSNVADRVEEILANPISEVLDLLPELIYFINADGLTAAANNLIAPTDALLKAVGAEIGKNDLSLNSLITAVDLDQLNFNFVYKLLKDKTGIVLSDDAGEPIGKYLNTFYFGELKTVTIYDDPDPAEKDVMGFHMVYTDTDTRYDMVTILLTLVLDAVVYEGNRAALVDLFKNIDEENADGIYTAIVAMLTRGEKSVAMAPYQWILTEYDVNGTGPNAGKVVSPLNLGGSIFGNGIYGPLYTREMGEYITKFLPLFINTYITLLGIDNGFGGSFRSLDDLLKGLLGNSIYKTELLQTIANGISGAIENLREMLGDDLFNYIVEILERSLKVDLNVLLNPQVPVIAEGDRHAFVNAICQMFSPVAPLLRWLLTDQSISLFTNRNGDDYIVLNGAKGYQDSIIPILEALHVPADSILTQAEYEAATDRSNQTTDTAADTAMLTNIVNPILDRVDEILADPLNEVFNILPGVVYFINSKGLDSAFKNLLNAVFQLLETIDPAIANVEALHKNGKVSLYPLMSQAMAELDLEELTFATIADLLVNLVNKQLADSPFELTGVLNGAIYELTLGVVRSFNSKREAGRPDYTMDYAGIGSGSSGAAGDKVDMVTLVMRIALYFISNPKNVIALEKMLAGSLSGDGYKFLCSLLESFQQFASTDDGMDKIMYTVYYIFYSALNAGVATNNGLAEFNGNYSFLNQLFATSQYSFIRQLELSFGDLLNKWTDPVVDDDEVAPKGIIPFFQGIIDFFKKIIAFFRNLFGG